MCEIILVGRVFGSKEGEGGMISTMGEEEGGWKIRLENGTIRWP